MKNTRYLYARAGLFMGGFIVLALGINCMLTVKDFGLSPWDSFFVALTQQFGMTIGFWMFALNLVFLLGVYLVDKTYINWATVVNVFMISVFVDMMYFFLHDTLIPLPDAPTFLVGALLIGTGIGMYVSASFGYAPQEGFMLALSERFQWSYRRAEIGVSVAVLICSYFMDGPIGYGTIFLTIAIGFIIQFSIERSNQLLQTLKIKGEYE